MQPVPMMPLTDGGPRWPPRSQALQGPPGRTPTRPRPGVWAHLIGEAQDRPSISSRGTRRDRQGSTAHSQLWSRHRGQSLPGPPCDREKPPRGEKHCRQGESGKGQSRALSVGRGDGGLQLGRRGRLAGRGQHDSSGEGGPGRAPRAVKQRPHSQGPRDRLPAKAALGEWGARGQTTGHCPAASPRAPTTDHH